MTRNWKINFNSEAGALTAILLWNNQKIDSYDYYNFKPEYEFNKCYNSFYRSLSDKGVVLSEADEDYLRSTIKNKFEEFEVADYWEWKSNCEKKSNAKLGDVIKNYECSFSQRIIDLCMEKIRRGQTRIFPGADKIPKNLDFITNSGDKYYARIVAIKILSENTQAAFVEAFAGSDDIIVLAFETTDKSRILAFGLDCINPSSNGLTYTYYSGKKNTVYNLTKLDVVVYSIIDIHSESPLSPNLIPALKYYKQQLSLITQKAETVKIRVNLTLLRDHFEVFKNLVVDEGLLVIPVLDKPVKLKGMTLSINDKNKESYNFYEAILSVVAADDANAFLESLYKQNIELPRGTDLALLDLIDLNEKDSLTFRRVLTDANSFSCTISNNIEGDRIRLSRIISGIENALESKVKNSSLVEMICKNDISVSCNLDNIKYEPDWDYIEKLKDSYPILAENFEQLMAVDKILQMDNSEIDIMLVQGPPGTGKTELILALAKELAKADFSTLITSNVHVACDNVVDRFINNKDIVLKRYTSSRGDKYLEEMVENKKKYIEKQVLEGFKCTDGIIKSKTVYDSLCFKVAEANDEINKILNTKKQYKEEIKHYKDLIGKKANMKTEVNASERELDALIESTRALIDERKEIRGEVEEINKEVEDYEKSLHASQSECDATYLNRDETEEELKTLYRGDADQQAVIENIEAQINEMIEKNAILKTKNGRLIERRQSFMSLSFLDIKNEVLNNYCVGKPFNNGEIKELLQKALPDIDNLNFLYNRLKQDDTFWNDGNMSFRTLEYLYFQCKDNSVLTKYLDKAIIESLDAAYVFHSVAPLKKKFMSIFPFIKHNGKNMSYYNECLRKIKTEFKKIQYNFNSFIIDIIQTSVTDDTLSSQKEEIRKTIESNSQKINSNGQEIEKLEKIREDAKEKKEDYKQLISRKIKEMRGIKSKAEELERTITTLQNSKDESIKRLKNAHIKLLHNTCKIVARDKEKAEINAKIALNRQSIDAVENEIEREHFVKAEVIDHYDELNEKLDIAVKHITKKITFDKMALERTNSKLDQLVDNGWSKENAFDFIFDYSSELEKMSNYDPARLEQCLLGRGKEFDEMFGLQGNSKGSLICMTTNQVASLINNVDKNLTFDYAIIDEASKCRFEDIIISLPKIKHLVLIGDFMQLDPMYDAYKNIDPWCQNTLSPEEWSALNKSSFGMLLSQFVRYNEEKNIESFDENPYVAVMKRQYRMNKGILELIQPIYSIHKGFELIDEKQSTSNDVQCINVYGNEIELNTSQYNPEEGEAIVSFLKEFQRNRERYPNIKTIGVITGYRAQVNYLRRKLKSIKIPGIQIGTFDRFQGREYDLVLISFVRTIRLGFISDIRRMNVAFSRAKNHLLIFGNIEALDKIAKKTLSSTDEQSNNDAKEGSFVVKTLIPTLYKKRKNYMSDKERVDALMTFLKENDYEQ